jgi:peptidase A4-like protein
MKWNRRQALTFGIILLFAPCTIVSAQQMVPTNRPGVQSYPVPPLGFDPERATDQQLQSYGLPVHPKNPAPEALKEWDFVVHNVQKRVVPEFGTSTNAHGPIRNHVSPVNGVALSGNWSGSVINASPPAIYNEVVGSFFVPAVSAPGPCPAGSPGFFSADWVGIDGFFNSGNDVIQAGSASDILCPDLSGQYFVWWEWFPDFEVPIANLSVNPGDMILVGVGVLNASQAPPLGAANFFILNLGSGTSVAFRAANPNPSPAYVGQSAEWIHELATVGGSISSSPLFGANIFAKEQAMDVFGNIHMPGFFGNGGVFMNSNETQVSLEQGGAVIAAPFPFNDKSTWILGPAGVHEIVNCGVLNVGTGGGC